MAEGGENDQSVQPLMELFSGRFTYEELEVLLHHNNDDCRLTADFLLSSDPDEIGRVLSQHVNEWEVVAPKMRRFKQSRPMVDRVIGGVIITQNREFSCTNCDHFWWRNVPERKMVAMCPINRPRCRRKYKPVPRNREWGIAEYHCGNCNKTFRGWGQMELVYSPCFGCGTPCLPLRIISQNELDAERDRGEGRRRRNRHQCMAPDCYNRYPGQIVYPPGIDPNSITCVHPESRRLNNLPVVVHASFNHQSTGSTIATFLPQGSSDGVYDDVKVFVPPLPPIGEN